MIIGIVVGVLLATRSTSKAPPAAVSSASDRNAPAALVKAADQVGFQPTTEPGVGELEDQPASAAHPPSNPNLLPVGEGARLHAQVQAYTLLPGALEAPFAYALPFVEVGLGLYLGLGLLVRPAAILACALMVVFIAAMAHAWARGLSLDCGCFGSLAREQVGLGTILRDAALGLPSLALALWPARVLSVDQAWLGRPDRFALRSGEAG